MSESGLNILAVVATPSKASSTRVAVEATVEQLRQGGANVDLLDFEKDPLPLFDPEVTYKADYYPALKARVEAADVLLLGTPDYHGSMSSALKNFLDHFWTEFAGKLFASIIGSYEKGLTVTDQIRTVARQCYAWALPYGVAYMDKADIKDGQIVSDEFRKRLEMLARDLRVYGALLKAQRQKDLEGDEPGFMARYRK